MCLLALNKPCILHRSELCNDIPKTGPRTQRMACKTAASAYLCFSTSTWLGFLNKSTRLNLNRESSRAHTNTSNEHCYRRDPCWCGVLRVDNVDIAAKRAKLILSCRRTKTGRPRYGDGDDSLNCSQEWKTRDALAQGRILWIVYRIFGFLAKLATTHSSQGQQGFTVGSNKLRKAILFPLLCC